MASPIIQKFGGIHLNSVWWKEAVIYQIYPKSFCDDNGDGYGDIRGIINKLPYVVDLGVDVIWLTPFFKSPMVDNGYDISDYTDIEPMFGNMEDMEELIEKAHELGLKILVDLVLNHTSSEHPWFIQAVASKENSYRDFYIFQETENGKPPNNWRSVFGGSAWERLDNSTYYLHTFHKEQPDLNWESPRMRSAIYQSINFWMDKGIQGFRIDAITFIKKGSLNTYGVEDNNDGLRSIMKDTLNQSGIHDFLQEMKTATYGNGEYMTVAEAPGVTYDSLGDYVGECGDFSMIFDFSYTDLDLQEDFSWYPKRKWTFQEYKSKLFESQLEHQKVGWVGLFNESHDQPRSIDKFFGIGDDSKHHYLKATVLATMFFFMRGTPFIYQGQELGIRNYRFTDIDELDDIAAKDNYNRALSLGANKNEAMRIVNERSRDHARTPMIWNSEKNAGFTIGDPWLPICRKYKEINIEEQRHQTVSILNFYKSMIALRKKEKDCIVYGEIQPILESMHNIIAYKRISSEGEQITIVTNLSDKPIEINHKIKHYKVLLSNYHTAENNRVFDDGWLRPYESVIVKTELN